LGIFTETPRFNAWIFSKLALYVHGDVLEIGSGIGNLSRLIIAHAAAVVLSDKEPHYLETLRTTFAGDPRVTVARYNLDGEPHPEIARRRFDAIVAINVLEHIRDDYAVVQRLATLLRPGGRLLIYVPACPFAYGSLDRALGHYRRYTAETLTALLRDTGLVVPRPTYLNLLGLLGWTINGRILRRKHLSPRQVALFERLVGLFRLEDRFHLPIGLGLHVAAQKV